MRKQILLLYIFSFLILINHSASGIPAYPFPMEITQPDGTKIIVIQRGDEHMKWAQTVDGYSLMRNGRGIYEFSTLNTDNDMVPSGIPARNETERSPSDLQFLSKTPKGLLYSKSQVNRMKSISLFNQQSIQKAFPTSGSRKLVCVLIGFTDKAFTKTKADFEALFNQVGYSADGATGSVNDYYRENSFGKLDLAVTVTGPYTASHNMAWYGANNSTGDDVNPRALVNEALILADPAINYANFDNDGDGKVDGVYVIYAGYGEEVTGVSTEAIWAHASSINPLTLDGKTISRYSCSSELRGNSGIGISRIGVICHEFGHVMGASDYYDKDFAENGSYNGTGKWDLMAEGGWNNNGATPAHHNPYTKIYTYGWATTSALPSGSSVTLENAEQNATSFYRLNTTTSNEFFLIENRQKHKFDSYIPGHGMIIYHVDVNYINTTSIGINSGSHQGLYPVCANATGIPPTTYGVINSAGLPFPGTGNKNAFTDTTLPNSLSWSGAGTEKPLTNISENTVNKTVTFTAPVYVIPPSGPTAKPTTNIIQTSFTANWNTAATAIGYRLDVATDEAFTNFVTGYNDKDVGNILTLSVTGLNARTQYYFRLRAYNSGGPGASASAVSVITLSNVPPAPVSLTAVSCNNFVTLKWRKISDPYFRAYRIYGGIANNPTSKMDSTTISISDTSKIISGLKHGQVYYFRVTAVNDDGPESPFSNQSSDIIKTGLIPQIKAKWSDVLICSNLGDSISGYQWYKGGLPISDAMKQYFVTDKTTGTYNVQTVDKNGCKNLSNSITITGLKSLTAFPNPASASVALTLNEAPSGTAVISIQNSSGIKVMEFQTENTTGEILKNIPVSTLADGVYVVQVVLNNAEKYTTKIVVKK